MVRNTSIRENIKVKRSLVETIEIAQLRCFGHMKRMTDNRLPKKIYERVSKGRKKSGRPKLT